ncbi:hypothetical protein BDR05DRAFT_1003099 [Suillus weaverae]|nr:hypothetical protein BDR05DRAFT_1003099 [Suillus weaverae]
MASILDADMTLQHSAINEARDEDCHELHNEQVSEGDSDCDVSDGPDDGCLNAESDSEEPVEDNEEDSLRFEAIQKIERLALSFLEQLAGSLRNPRADLAYTRSSPAAINSRLKYSKIELQLADRHKTSSEWYCLYPGQNLPLQSPDVLVFLALELYDTLLSEEERV